MELTPYFFRRLGIPKRPTRRRNAEILVDALFATRGHFLTPPSERDEDAEEIMLVVATKALQNYGRLPPGGVG